MTDRKRPPTNEIENHKDGNTVTHASKFTVSLEYLRELRKKRKDHKYKEKDDIENINKEIIKADIKIGAKT